jgi:hypothetical protein
MKEKEIVIFFSDGDYFLCDPDSFSVGQTRTQLKDILANLSNQKKCNDGIIINIDDKKILVIYPEEEIPEEERESIIPLGIQTMFLAFHTTGMKMKSQNIICQLKKNFQNVKIYWSFYSHIPDETSLWKVLSDLIWALYKNKTDKAIEYFDKLAGLIKKKPIVPNFSLLIHRIAHFFLPLDIDLQGISEAEDAKKIEYLKEALREKKNNHYYRQKLADLWYMVIKEDFEGRKINEYEKVKPRDSRQLLANDKAIIDLIKESGKQDKVKDLWEVFLDLCGIKYNSRKPFENKFSMINSPISSFMCLLDKKIEKNMINMIEKPDVEEILNYFMEGWKVEGANPEIIKSFHDWFCALMDCLEKIREGLKDEQGK